MIGHDSVHGLFLNEEILGLKKKSEKNDSIITIRNNFNHSGDNIGKYAFLFGLGILKYAKTLKLNIRNNAKIWEMNNLFDA